MREIPSQLVIIDNAYANASVVDPETMKLQNKIPDQK